MLNSMIGKKLKHRRNELDLSLRALAEQAEVSAVFLSQIENGKSNPSLNSLQKIAFALKVPLNYFLSKEPISDQAISQYQILDQLVNEGRANE